MDRFDFLELDSDGPKAPRQPTLPEAETPVTGWKPLRLRAVEVIGEPGDAAGLAAAMRIALAEPLRAVDKATQLRRVVAERFSVAAMTDGVLDFYGYARDDAPKVLQLVRR